MTLGLINSNVSIIVRNDSLFCFLNFIFTQRNTKGSAELTWDILNFRKDQDVRLKIGYEVSDKVSFLQLLFGFYCPD